MENILYILLLFCIGILFILFLIKKKKHINFLLIFFFLSFSLRLILIFLNENLHFFAQKLATNKSIINYLNWITNQTIIDQSFVVQTLINTPSFILFGPSRMNLLLTNAFFGAITGIIVFAYLNYIYDSKIAKYGFILFSIYPAAINFSIFGLRDILIYFFVSIYILSILSIFNKKCVEAKNISLFAFSSICLFLLRKELLLILVFFPFILILYKFNHIKNRIKSINARFLFVSLVGTLIITIICFGGFYLYNKIISSFGYNSFTSPLKVASNIAEVRFMRSVGEEFGSGTHILPPNIYLNTNLLIRIFLQTIGMIIIPLPWLINKLPQLFALFDSIFIIFCLLWTYYGLKSHFLARSEKKVILFLLLNFLLAIFAMGFVISNAGNAFRMRLSILPYLLISASIYFGKRKISKMKYSS